MAGQGAGGRITGERNLDDTFPRQPGRTHPTDFQTLDVPPELCDTEEIYPKDLEIEIPFLEIILFSVRSVATFICILGIILVIVATTRGNRHRYKSWRLYVLTSLMILAWLMLSLYRDYIDEYFVQEIWRVPQRNSIYECFRNLTQGLSLYLIVLLLSHLSDFQHRGSWLWLIAMVILVPLVYSVVWLVVELFLPFECNDNPENPERSAWTKNSFEVTTASVTIKVAFYNVATTILLLVFSRNLCTKRLYGTYSEHRSTLVVLISRWTFVFLILHNLAAMTAYGALIASKNQVCQGCDEAVLVKQIADEAALFLVVLAVPASYLIAWLAQCLCGMDDEANTMELEKIDKVYQEVWTPSAGSTTTQIQNQPLPQPSNGSYPTRNATPSANPAGSARNGSRADSVPGNKTGSQSTLTSIDSLGELPSTGSQKNRRPNSRQKNRESYFEAVSMGSFDGSGSDRYSVTTDPVDL